MFQHWKCDISTNIGTLISYASVGKTKNQHWYKWNLPKMVYCLPALEDKIVTPTLGRKVTNIGTFISLTNIGMAKYQHWYKCKIETME